MLDRFTASSSDITSAGLSRLLQEGPVRALLLTVVGIGALTFGRPLVQSIDFPSFGGGQVLPALAVAGDLSASSDCRSDACTLETVAPATAPPSNVPVRWLPDPVSRLRWPSRPAYPSSFMAEETQAWIAERVPISPGATSLTWKLTVGSNIGGLHYANLELASGGYVSRLVFPQSTGVAPLTVESHGADAPRRKALHERMGNVLRSWRAAGNGRGPGGYIDHDLLPPAELLPKDPLLITVSPEGIEFQPMPMPMRLQLPSEMVGRIRAGDPATLRFEAPSGFSPPIEVAAKVTGTRGDQALVETDEPTDRWLRTYFDQAFGRAPATDRLTLRVRESLGGRAGTGVRVPESAVVRRPGEAGSIVWVVADGIASPVSVRVGTTDGEFVAVNEVQWPHSGAIAPNDWRAMTPEQRARLYRLQMRRPNDENLLLHANARVVSRPGAALRPGDAVRSH
jgi:hypothetical protein